MNTVSKTVTIKLDKERSMTYNKRAEYRMSTLDRPFLISDLNKPRRSGGALIAWVWACLDPKDALAFKDPEDLADVILSLSELEIIQLLKQLGEIYAATAVPEDGSPKEISSTNLRSPSLS